MYGRNQLLKRIQHENRKMADELAELKSSFGIQETQLNSLRESLSKATKANNAMKLELQALRAKVNKQKSATDELYERLDDLEQYSRKNSLEIHGVPEDLYTSAEDVVIKLSELLNEPVGGEDIDITHKIYGPSLRRSSHHEKKAFNLQEQIVINLNGQKTPINKVVSKTIYKEFRNRVITIPSAQKKYSCCFINDTLDWKEIYGLPHRVTSDTKLREFQFKLLNRYLVTNVFLNKIGVLPSPSMFSLRKGKRIPRTYFNLL